MTTAAQLRAMPPAMLADLIAQQAAVWPVGAAGVLPSAPVRLQRSFAPPATLRAALLAWTCSHDRAGFWEDILPHSRLWCAPSVAPPGGGLAHRAKYRVPTTALAPRYGWKPPNIDHFSVVLRLYGLLVRPLSRHVGGAAPDFCCLPVSV
jgi:hypothetical protein